MSIPLQSLEQVLRSVHDNPHSDFYRKRLSGVYTELFPLTEDTWRRVPLLGREDITSVPFWERVFVPRGEVPYIRNTYGSSGKHILITPRTSYGSYANPYNDMGMRRVMSFFASAHHEFPRMETGVLMWFGDVGNLEMSAQIVKAAQIDALYITPYTALMMADMLLKLDVIRQIRVVQLCGERCSPLQYRTLKQRYPEASVYNNFASSETRETVAVTCAHDRSHGGSMIIESVPEMHCELVHPETGEIVTETGVHGILVITSLMPNIPFPLVRYATGDVAVYTLRTCECEKRARGFEVLGRASVFPVRLVKGELTVNAVETALATLSDIPPSYFEIHYTEESTHTTALPRVHLVLCEPQKKLDTEQLARDIEKELYVFPSYSYATGVAEGIYLPLSISFIERAPDGPLGKSKAPIVVRHMDKASMTGPARVQ